jgi:hypothetical protein
VATVIGLDDVKRREIICPWRKSKAYRRTDWAIPAPIWATCAR